MRIGKVVGFFSESFIEIALQENVRVFLGDTVCIHEVWYGIVEELTPSSCVVALLSCGYGVAIGHDAVKVSSIQIAPSKRFTDITVSSHPLELSLGEGQESIPFGSLCSVHTETFDDSYVFLSSHTNADIVIHGVFGKTPSRYVFEGENQSVFSDAGLSTSGSHICVTSMIAHASLLQMKGYNVLVFISGVSHALSVESKQLLSECVGVKSTQDTSLREKGSITLFSWNSSYVFSHLCKDIYFNAPL